MCTSARWFHITEHWLWKHGESKYKFSINSARAKGTSAKQTHLISLCFTKSSKKRKRAFFFFLSLNSFPGGFGKSMFGNLFSLRKMAGRNSNILRITGPPTPIQIWVFLNTEETGTAMKTDTNMHRYSQNHFFRSYLIKKVPNSSETRIN